MGKRTRSFRFNMVLLFGLSMLLSGTATYILYRLLQMFYHTTQYEDVWTRYRYWIREIGDLNIFLIIFIPLSFGFFFLLTKRYATYFKEITRGIHQLANADFNRPIHIDSNDEFEDIARDINLAGRQLQQAITRGDSAENAKERLILNLAHDLRTPLTSVLGYLDFMLKGKDELTEEQRLHYTGIAYNKSQRLEKLIEELFEIARLNYGQLTLKKSPIDLNELMAQLTEELYPALEKEGLTARVKAAPALTICGDGEQLARVLENLLTNAIRYGKEGQFIDLTGYAEGDEAVVQVINYGSRIRSEELPHIFEMLYTGDKARTQKEGGSGIGLFIAKNIVEQHRGSLTVRSDEIRTCFEIRLPRQAEDQGTESLATNI